MLARGEAEPAARGLQRALENVNLTTIERARLLEALIEVTLGAGDTIAGPAASDLETIAAANPRQALRAMALRARASVDLAGGTPATSPLREALQLWQSVDAPYEVARTRMLVADSYRLEGDASGARQELEAAAAAFERLGALPDLAFAREKLADLPGTQPVRTSRAFLFTDIVDSTRLAETLGDETWADLLRWHDVALRGLFLEHHGEEVDHAGDGFLVAFDSAAAAIKCAVAVQRMLTAHRREHGFAPRIRIGIHTADAVRSGRAFRGSGVHQAARIAALAGADEILVSLEAADAAGAQYGEVRAVELRGIARPVQVVTLAWH
jgi:class 3 adenylate cyclase